MKNAKVLAVLVIVNFLLLMVLGFINNIFREKIVDKQLQIDFYIDSLKTQRNENGELVATIGVLQSERVENLLEIKTKDKSILKLQEKVKEYEKKLKKGGSVTVAGTSTNVSGTVPLIPIDTFNINKPQNKPVSFSFSDEWVNLSGTVKNDSLSFKLRVTNDYSLALIDDKKAPYIELTELNPYTDVSYLRTFQILKKPPSRFGLSVQAGYGITKENLSPYIGVGISYTILRI